MAAKLSHGKVSVDELLQSGLLHGLRRSQMPRRLAVTVGFR
ncbi:hypothetical protein [Rhizobium sp. SAFR-030]